MAGLLNRTIAISSLNPNGISVVGSVIINGNDEVSFDQLVPANSTAQVYAWAFAHATLQSFFLAASGGSVTVAFYNASSLLTTYNLVNGQCVSWNIDDYNANATQWPIPFASDVTSIKVTCTPAVTLTGVAELLV